MLSEDLAEAQARVRYLQEMLRGFDRFSLSSPGANYAEMSGSRAVLAVLIAEGRPTDVGEIARRTGKSRNLIQTSANMLAKQGRLTRYSSSLFGPATPIPLGGARR